ncbi:membrane protein insertion efficiency factor YidD [Polymorphospora rubra]|uniref:membrane protein insertion efficiency factor YidD n=1 Tax=Polymorphospora rubra TaxID=338584 RepID=UPI003F4D5B71
MMHARRRDNRRRRKRDWLDGCDVCSCDFPSCNFGLFSGLLLLGSATAGAAGRVRSTRTRRRPPLPARPGTSAAVRPGTPAAARPGPSTTVRTSPAFRSGMVDRAGLAAIRGYRRWLSHRLPTRCRFTPTCSAYGLEAVDRFGLAVGGELAAARVRRCRSDVPYGTPDPVPPAYG